MKRAISILYQSPRIAAIIAVLILLVIFNTTRRPSETANSRGYETWLRSVEEVSRVAAQDPAAIPEITISLRSRREDPSLNWKFSTIKDPERTENNQRILRLLELIRSSRILERSRTSAELHLTVTEKDKIFEAYFERSDAKENVSLGTFLKLFQIYVTTVPGSAEKIS